MFFARYFQEQGQNAPDIPAPENALEPEAEASRETSLLHLPDPVVRYATVGIFIILFLAALQLSRHFSMPIVAGLVFGFVLGPVADRLTRWGVPQSVAASIIVISFAAIVTAAIANLTAPLAEWIDSLPAMIAALRSKGEGVLNVITRVKSVSAGAGEPAAAVAVENTNPLIDIFTMSSSVGAQLMLFVCTVFFYLMTRRQIVARVLWLTLDKQARRPAYGFFENVEAHVASYFGFVTLVNLGVAANVTAIAWGGGLSYPLLWGVLAGVLNYVPYVGPLIMFSALLSAKLIASVDLVAILWPALAFLSMHLVEANVVTPSLVGRRFTVSPLLVFLSFAFWLWMWGPVGAMLASPLLLIGVLARSAWREYREVAAPESVGAVAIVVGGAPSQAGTNASDRRSEDGKSDASS